jgi:Zn finger protein HypA/HybF involved in hydrogenase expression
MHDTFLNERIYDALLRICQENKIQKMSKICLEVNTDSHINEISLREHFRERNNNVVGDWTEIIVEIQDVGKLNAIIKSVEGESLNG